MSRNIATGTHVADRLNTRSQGWLQPDQSPFQNLRKNSYGSLRPRSGTVERSAIQTSSAKPTKPGFLNLFGQGWLGRLTDNQPGLRIQTLDRLASLNNTLDTAYRLGDLTGKAQLDWSDSVSRNNASDFFQFSLAKRTRIKFALEGLTANATLRLFQGNGGASKAGTGNQAGWQSQQINRSLSAGTYYLQVAHNDSAEARYTLTGQSSGRSPDAGDTITKPLDAGLLNQTKRQYRAQLGQGDRADVYRFDLSKEATVNLALSNTSGNAPTLQLSDSTGAAIPPASGSSSQSMRQKLIPGSYFVQVGTTSTGKTRYTLDLSASSNFATSGITTSPPNSRPTSSRPPAPFGSNPFGWGNSSGNNSGWGNTGNQNSGSGNSGNGAFGGGAFGGGTGSSNWNTGRSLIRITKTTKTDTNGLVELDVAFVQGGNTVDHLTAVAGQPGKQAFRTGTQSRSGSMEPLPEGYWNLGTVEWASGRKGDFSRSWADANDGVGPVWVSMTPSFRTDRSAIGFHFDNNADRGLPGTVGCVGIANRSDLSRFVSWFDNATTAPKVAMVDWGLGTV